MSDLHERFTALDSLDAPRQWGEVERRAALPEPTRNPSWLHGAWVAAASAAGVLVFVGGVAMGRWIPGGGRPVFGSGSIPLPVPTDVGVLAAVGAGAAGGGVLLLAALTLGFSWRRSHRSSMRSTKGMTMETLERTTVLPEQTIERVTRINKWLILAVAVLVAALAGIGAWLAISQFATSDIEQLVIDSNVAVNDGDVEAYLALHSTDTVFRTVLDGSVTVYEGEDEVRDWMNLLFNDWNSEIAGDIVVEGEYVTFPNTVSWGGQAGYEGISVVRVQDGLITEQHFIGKSVPRS